MKKIVFAFLLILILLICLSSALIVSIKESKKLSGLQIKEISKAESKATLNNNDYVILFVPEEQIAPFFGLAKNEFGTKIALIREDLPDDIQTFVIKHEIYHLQDTKHKGFASREINANLAGAYYEPLGFLKTIWLTIMNTERIKYYFFRF